MALPLAIYVAAYLSLGEVIWAKNGAAVGRGFNSPWQCDLFKPLARCESTVFRRGVAIWCHDEVDEVRRFRYSPYEEFDD